MDNKKSSEKDKLNIISRNKENNSTSLISEYEKELVENGVFKGNSLINRDNINKIDSEIRPYFDSVKGLINYQDRIIRKSPTVFEVSDLCAVSESVASYVLKDEIIDSIEKYFNEPVRVGQFRYLKQLAPENDLLTHCDGDRCVLLMLSLSGQSKYNGPTFFFKKSHKRRKEISKLMIKFDQYEKYKSELDLYIANDLNPGDFVLFDVRTWHGRISPKLAGREVIWISFFPISNEQKTIDSLFKVSSLALLNSKQKDVLRITSKFTNNKKNLENQYFNSIKVSFNEGTEGKFFDYLFAKFSRSYYQLKQSMKKFLFLKFKKNKKLTMNSLFAEKLMNEKDIDPEQMI